MKNQKSPLFPGLGLTLAEKPTGADLLANHMLSEFDRILVKDKPKPKPKVLGKPVAKTHTLTVKVKKSRAKDEPAPPPPTVELTPDAVKWLKALQVELGIDPVAIVSLALRDYGIKLHVSVPV